VHIKTPRQIEIEEEDISEVPKVIEESKEENREEIKEESNEE